MNTEPMSHAPSTGTVRRCPFDCCGDLVRTHVPANNATKRTLRGKKRGQKQKARQETLREVGPGL